ncbi:response regulator transcription factor [Clostridium sediminicola]|uniref:response regulator transcription factor n=1 Tax=Clostridium sediminicola TaxID=3114879 RepID=UPI0031F21636
MTKILIVEDDELLNEGLCLSLCDIYEVKSAFSCEEAKVMLLNDRYDLILLDVNLPDGSGIELCMWIKGKVPEQRVIFLSANDTEATIIKGLQSGGEDYITKPFSISVLKEKMKIILNRIELKTENDDNFYRLGDIIINFDKKEVYIKEKLLELTLIEYKLLTFIIENKSQVLTREVILEKLWDSDGNFVDGNTLSVNIRRLRKKIEKNPSKPKLIKTVFGIGYTWGGEEY